VIKVLGHSAKEEAEEHIPHAEEGRGIISTTKVYYQMVAVFPFTSIAHNRSLFHPKADII
jgi:hypothetical protein